MISQDKFNLERYRSVQDTCYHRVKAELSMGHKRSHWIWFIFPQLKGLGESQTAKEYSIESLIEAQAYLNDILLGGRLRECCQLLITSGTSDLNIIVGKLDAMKVRSCVTLFNALPNPEPIFQQVLDTFFAGEPDKLTLNLLDQQSQ